MKIIGYAIAGNMRTRLVAEALHMAVRNCPVTRGETVFHSDRGSQYTSADYAEIMNTYGIRASVGRTGSCYDNAAAESFNTLLQEGGSEPEDLPNTETRHKGCDSLDRVTLQSETTSLGVRVPHTQPRPPRMEPTPESSLEIPFFSSVHKTHSTPNTSRHRTHLRLHPMNKPQGITPPTGTTRLCSTQTHFHLSSDDFRG